MEQKQKNERFKNIKYKSYWIKKPYIFPIPPRQLGLHNWNGSRVLFGQRVN